MEDCRKGEGFLQPSKDGRKILEGFESHDLKEVALSQSLQMNWAALACQAELS